MKGFYEQRILGSMISYQIFFSDKSIKKAAKKNDIPVGSITPLIMRNGDATLHIVTSNGVGNIDFLLRFDLKGCVKRNISLPQTIALLAHECVHILQEVKDFYSISQHRVCAQEFEAYSFQLIFQDLLQELLPKYKLLTGE